MQKKEEDVLVSLIIFVKNIVFFTHKQHILYSLFCVSYSEASFFPVFLSFCHFHLFSVLLSFHLYSSCIKKTTKTNSPYAAWGGRPCSFSLKTQFSLNPQIASACRSCRATHWTTTQDVRTLLKCLNRREQKHNQRPVRGPSGGSVLCQEVNDSFYENIMTHFQTQLNSMCVFHPPVFASASPRLSSSPSRYLKWFHVHVTAAMWERVCVWRARALQSKSNRSVNEWLGCLWSEGGNQATVKLQRCNKQTDFNEDIKFED